MVRIAINGFGRIGRITFRVATLYHPQDLDIVAVNTSGSMDIEGWAHLIKYDTTYSKFPGNVTSQEIRKADKATDETPEIGMLIVNGKNCMVLAQKDPEKLPWKKYQIDVVVESTGVFTDESGALKHAKSGAKRVVISAPSRGGNVNTYVLGVNEYDGKAEVLPEGQEVHVGRRLGNGVGRARAEGRILGERRFSRPVHLRRRDLHEF